MEMEETGNSSEQETANTSYEYNYEYDDVCLKTNVAKIGSIAIPVFFTLVVVFSLVGNILDLVILVRFLRLRDRYLMGSLAISDLIFTVGLPFWSYQFMWGWIFGDAMCKGVSFVFSVGFYSTTVFLIMITLWRYIQNVLIFRKPNIRALSFLSWVVSIALALPALFQSSVVSDPDDPNTLYCLHKSNEAKLAATYQQNIFFVVAFLIMGFCNIRFLYLLYITYKRKEELDKKMCSFTRHLFYLVVVFFIGWAPYNIVIFLQSLSYYNIKDFTDCTVSNNLDYALYVCTMVAFSHCCINPVLNVLIIRGLRNELRMMLQCICPQISTDIEQPQIAIDEEPQD